MMLFWKIRYLDRTDKQFKDRCLYLDTKTLDPVARAAVELVAENRSSKIEREILKYRHLFVEGIVEKGPSDPSEWNKFGTVGPSEYLEDETGQEISHDEMARILTGSPSARVIPSGAKRHDIDLMLAEPKPIPLAEASLSPDEIRLLGYFVRDLQELLNSAFMKNSPGMLTSSSGFMTPSSNPTLETAATDDEIRSFVTIFRRLYMTGAHDPASFVKVVPVFVNALGDHPYGKWVEGTAKEYQRHLAAVPEARPFVPTGTCTFTTKRLIDVFLYTQYAHQPDEKKQRQYEACLAELHGKRAVFTWMFLTELWKCSLEIGNAGKVIAWWFKHYCDHHKVSPDVLKSLRDHHAGLGAAEKEEDRRERLFGEKVEQLAADLWEQAGRPQGGPTRFLITARDQLTKLLQR
jgi:hypothetical protein